MTREEAINVLKTDSCYECSWGCNSPASCHCSGCDLAEATRIAIESLATGITFMPNKSVGKWEEKSVFEGGIQEWQSARCSVCNKYHTTPYLYYFDNFNYCPNCGARMVVEE